MTSRRKRPSFRSRDSKLAASKRAPLRIAARSGFRQQALRQLRMPIRRVDLEGVEEDEEGHLPALRQPLAQHLAWPIAQASGIHPIGVEPLGESQVSGQGRAAREGQGPISVLAEHFGQRGGPLRQDSIALAFFLELLEVLKALGQAVARGVLGREQRGVGGRRPRRLADGMGEADALGGQSVDIRAGRPGITVAAQPVGTQGVHGDQQDVLRRQGRRTQQTHLAPEGPGRPGHHLRDAEGQRHRSSRVEGTSHVHPIRLLGRIQRPFEEPPPRPRGPFLERESPGTRAGLLPGMPRRWRLAAPKPAPA